MENQSLENQSMENQSMENQSVEADIGLACPRCLLPFGDNKLPHTLPECQHVCCSSCLKQIAKWDANSTIECPRCNATSRIPNGGTAVMATNEWLHRIVQQHQMGKLREHLDDICHDLKGLTEDAEKSVANLKELEKDTEASLKMEEEQVDKCVQAVQAEAWVLKAKIRQIGESRLKSIREDIALLESRAQDIISVHKIAETSQDNGNIQHIKYDDLSTQMEKLLSTTAPTTHTNKTPHVAKFLREKVTLGRVIKLRNLELVYEFTDQFKRVQDIAVTPNGLLVLCDSEANAVTVHCKGSHDNNNRSRYTRLMQLALTSSNPNPPTGVAATFDGKYIVARRTGIEVYSMAGAYQTTYRTISKTDSSQTDPYVYSLTTTGDGKILAGDISRNVITIHDLTGDITATLSTTIKPGSIAPAWDKHLVAITDWDTGKLCVQHIGSGSQILTLDIPEALGVCYDQKAGSLLVGRSERARETGDITIGTGVIEQYNSSGDRTLIVCLAQGLYGACAMAFAGGEMLAVADYKAVKLYRVT